MICLRENTIQKKKGAIAGVGGRGTHSYAAPRATAIYHNIREEFGHFRDGCVLAEDIDIFCEPGPCDEICHVTPSIARASLRSFPSK